MKANSCLKCNKEKQRLSQVREKQSQKRKRERERERDSVYMTVPEMRLLLLPPQWVTLTGYFLCSFPPLCD